MMRDELRQESRIISDILCCLKSAQLDGRQILRILAYVKDYALSHNMKDGGDEQDRASYYPPVVRK